MAVFGFLLNEHLLGVGALLGCRHMDRFMEFCSELGKERSRHRITRLLGCDQPTVPQDHRWG